MSDAKKLSSMDASFLYLETPEMPMHVGSMAIFRLPEDYKGDFFEDFKAMIASRLHVAPILKARLEKAPLDIDHPSWVEDDQFDIDRHIFRGSLPAPHDRATLERIVGWMHAKLLNRARPLWEFYVFEGMKDNEIGLYSKMHHACIDGGAGAALTNMIYDVTPVPRTSSRRPRRRKSGRSRATSPPICWIPISSCGASRSMPRRPPRASTCRAREKAISARSCSTTRCSRSKTR
jgi:diacylglycerol O-acyltransferase